MSQTDPRLLQEELEKKTIDRSVKKLAFDPTTGELIVKSDYETASRPGEVVVDQIYKDGFFSTVA